jgi:Zn-dependent protease
MSIAALGNIMNAIKSFDVRLVLLRILILSISLSFHEFAHAWTANKLGDDTARLKGRMTLNPLVHIDPIGALVFLVAGIGWAKPTPINPTRFDRKVSMKKGIILTSVAGPIANIILAVISAILFFVTATIGAAASAPANSLIMEILVGDSTQYGLFNLMYVANISLAIFNLLPVPPLDGYKVFGAALPGSLYYKIMEYERVIGLVFLALVFFGQNIIYTIITTIRIPFDFVIWNPLSLLFQWIWRMMGLI